MFLRRKTTQKNGLVDPICGMDLQEDEVRYRTEHKGQTHYFCSPRCKAEFKKGLRSSQMGTPKKKSKPKKSSGKSCH